jgi:transcription antitermination factor NusG
MSIISRPRVYCLLMIACISESAKLKMPHWFAIRTSPRWEFRASSELSLRGLEIYLPVCRAKHKWSDRVQIVDEPLFPGYLFGRFHLDNRVRVLQTTGVKQIVSIGNTPAPMSDGEIENLRTLVSARPVLMPWPYLPAGQRVRIGRGPLAGVEGFVVRADEGAFRIVVSVDLLQRSVAAEIDRESISSAQLGASGL